ncbi:hypothetical protein AAFF_G00161400 [Aldrovandia affinis]|uniref:Uncharacterized protein n=1 Tax=Aldrovandia affinis TaxID=143900 RepID=A0AAD7RMC6_9TELE|nr:hypothetical protein AAFF_G00161400 [Aldrovandia affinis]
MAPAHHITVLHFNRRHMKCDLARSDQSASWLDDEISTGERARDLVEEVQTGGINPHRAAHRNPHSQSGKETAGVEKRVPWQAALSSLCTDASPSPWPSGTQRSFQPCRIKLLLLLHQGILGDRPHGGARDFSFEQSTDPGSVEFGEA